MKKKISLIITVINSIIVLCLLTYIIFDKCNDKYAKDIFKMNVNSIVEVKSTTDTVGESYGTGVIYDSSGLLLTNAHVISYTSLGETKTFDSYGIRFVTREDYQSVTLIKYDAEIDLAILKIDDGSIKYDVVEFSNNNYTYGDKVYAKNNPDGSQTWVEVRGNKIRNGGINSTPRPWNPSTGLSGLNK